MRSLSYTLLGDGPSDRLLRFPVGWALRDLGVAVDQAQWADLSFARPKPVGLADRAKRALELYPAELLVVHRDAEDARWNARVHVPSSTVVIDCDTRKRPQGTKWDIGAHEVMQ